MPKMLKIKKAKRKFYNKWLYKTSLKLDGASIFRIYSIDQIVEFLEDENKNVRSYFLGKARLNKNEYLRLIEFLSGYSQESYSLRIESSILDIYSNDKEFNRCLRENFLEIVRSSYEPEEYLTRTDENDVILAKKYPKEHFKYRVYVLAHKIKDPEEKNKYVKWIEGQPGVSISEAVKAWFLTTHYNWDRRYILVKEESDLLMLKMRNSDVLGKVLRYRLLDK